MNNQRYSIDGWKVVDAESDPVPEIYIRELLDMPSDEYRNSKLSVYQKLEVIGFLGLDKLIGVLDDLYRLTGKGYDAKQEALYAVQRLREQVNSAGVKPL